MLFPKVQESLPTNLDLFYNGKWQPPQDGKYQEIYSPGNGKLIAKVAFAGPLDTAAAIEAAYEAFPGWRATNSLQRGKALNRVAQVLREHANELALVDALDTGNPVSIMAKDAIFAADYVDYFAGLIHAVHGETTHLDDSSFNYTLREPIGQ